MSDLEKLIESNAKAIAAISSDIAEMKRYQDNLTEKMGVLTMHQIRNYDTTARLDARQDQLALRAGSPAFCYQVRSSERRDDSTGWH